MAFILLVDKISAWACTFMCQIEFVLNHVAIQKPDLLTVNTVEIKNLVISIIVSLDRVVKLVFNCSNSQSSFCSSFQFSADCTLVKFNNSLIDFTSNLQFCF